MSSLGDVMNRTCRNTATPIRRRRQLAMAELLRHARIVTDPNKLAYLNAEVARCKARTESDAVHIKCEAPL
jgi:hypothetical protein